jgi:hypothetical protein
VPRRTSLGVLAVLLALPRPGRADDDAYARVVARGHPSWLRLAIEETLAVGSGGVWYWLTPEKQVADWDYPSWRQRLTFAAWRFDNNEFDTNFAWHPFSGAGYHVLARSNELSLPAATAAGLGATLAWEYLLEFREKVSVNDVLVETGAALTLGEFVHWLGRYLSSANDRHVAGEAASWTLGYWYALHGTLDGRPTPSPERVDPLGYDADIWHRFRIAQGLVFTGDSRPRAMRLRLEGELFAMPFHLRPGGIRRFFADANLARLRLWTTFADRGVNHDFLSDVLLLGVHLQDVDARGHGHAATLGAALAFRYRREYLESWSDRLGVVHLPGPAADLHLLLGDARLTLTARAGADFAGVDSAAYAPWKADHPDVREKSILAKQGYYYAWGASGRLSIEFVLPQLALGGSIWAARWNSQEGLDRSQHAVTADVDAHDRATEHEAWLRVTPLPPVYVELRTTTTERESRLGGVHRGRSRGVHGVEIGAEF